MPSPLGRDGSTWAPNRRVSPQWTSGCAERSRWSHVVPLLGLAKTRYFIARDVMVLAPDETCAFSGGAGGAHAWIDAGSAWNPAVAAGGVKPADSAEASSP